MNLSELKEAWRHTKRQRRISITPELGVSWVPTWRVITNLGDFEYYANWLIEMEGLYKNE